MQEHCLLGLRILNLVVTEFNQPTPGRTLTQHRKLAVAFRDAALFKVFQLSLAALRQLHANGRTATSEKVAGTGGLRCYGGVCLWTATLP